MDIAEKLTVLSDAAKYDAACTSSGVDRAGAKGKIGNAAAAGICHSFASDGRCISLLKILMSNACMYDCGYCINRRSNDIKRATFTPHEIAGLTMEFYRRNYIEGLFLSSAVVGSPDRTMELMIDTLSLLRGEYGFMGYIHAKVIPGADDALIERLAALADRVSVNIELPSQESLALIAPDKKKDAILRPMGSIRNGIAIGAYEKTHYRHAKPFAPAGQSTQMIIGATPENDMQILRLTEGLYGKYRLKRVFYSAYMPVNSDSRLPALNVPPPLLREHRLYQADWLLRFYGFRADEILDDKNPWFNELLDPKCNWAINHPEFFPVEVNRADREALLRVPGIGPKSADRILLARRSGPVNEYGLKKLGVVMKRAKYFILCGGRRPEGAVFREKEVLPVLSGRKEIERFSYPRYEQFSMFRTTAEDTVKALTGEF